MHEHNELRATPARGINGFSLVEVLVALLVMSVGLLGLAALQTTGVQSNTAAYMRSQATSLGYDIADRMRANRFAAIDGEYTEDFAGALPDCGDAAAGGSVAERDMSAWRISLICALPLGNGRIVQNGRTFTITVQWDDTRGEGDLETFAMTTSL